MMKRIFLAMKIVPGQVMLDLYDDIRLALLNSSIKWVEKDNFHITLKFIGDCDESQVEEIKNSLEVITEYPAINISFDRLGFFGRERAPKVIWIGIVYNSKLQNLFCDIESALNIIGVEKEEREFEPHLTFGRVRRIQEPGKLTELIDQYRKKKIQECIVNEVILYESRLSKRGAKYYPLKKFNLK